MLALGIGEPISVSISSTGGLTRSDAIETLAHAREHMEHTLVRMLAGRAAEELVHGEITAGAGGSPSSDLGNATEFAIRLETAFGLGQTGLVLLPIDGAENLTLHHGIHDAVRTTLNTAYAGATKILKANRASLESLAEAPVQGWVSRPKRDHCGACLDAADMARRCHFTSPADFRFGSRQQRHTQD